MACDSCIALVCRFSSVQTLVFAYFQRAKELTSCKLPRNEHKSPSAFQQNFSCSLASCRVMQTFQKHKLFKRIIFLLTLYCTIHMLVRLSQGMRTNEWKTSPLRLSEEFPHPRTRSYKKDDEPLLNLTGAMSRCSREKVLMCTQKRKLHCRVPSLKTGGLVCVLDEQNRG
jgi:hypothetical protein